MRRLNQIPFWLLFGLVLFGTAIIANDELDPHLGRVIAEKGAGQRAELPVRCEDYQKRFANGGRPSAEDGKAPPPPEEDYDANGKLKPGHSVMSPFGSAESLCRRNAMRISDNQTYN